MNHYLVWLSSSFSSVQVIMFSDHLLCAKHRSRETKTRMNLHSQGAYALAQKALPRQFLAVQKVQKVMVTLRCLLSFQPYWRWPSPYRAVLGKTAGVSTPVRRGSGCKLLGVVFCMRSLKNNRQLHVRLFLIQWWKLLILLHLKHRKHSCLHWNTCFTVKHTPLSAIKHHACGTRSY